MATVLEECIAEEQRSVVSFFWKKGLNAKDTHKDMFPVYGGKSLSFKVVQSWVDRGCKYFADEEDVETEVQKSLRQQSKHPCCGLRCTGKAMVQLHQCRWRICRKINVFFPVSNITCFMFYIHL
jgi:hypothetical protein